MAKKQVQKNTDEKTKNKLTPSETGEFSVSSEEKAAIHSDSISEDKVARETTDQQRLGASSDLASDAYPVDQDRLTKIQQTAYFLAAERGFGAGEEVDDWLRAEHLIDQQKKQEST